MTTPPKRPDIEDIRAAYTGFARIAVELFQTQGEVAPQLIALTLGEDSGVFDDMEIVNPELVASFYKTEKSKGMVTAVIRAILADDSPIQGIRRKLGKPRPALVVQVSEAWSANGVVRDADGQMIQAGRREDRCEVVMIAVHTLTTSAVGFCPIIDTPTRHCEFAPIDLNGRIMFRGRMSMEGDEAPY
jgi:hypothetical protein